VRDEKRLQVALVVAIVAVGMAGYAFAGQNPEIQMALDMQARWVKRTCTLMYPSCSSINQVYDGTGYMDVIVVIYHFNGVTGLEYGVDWGGPDFAYFSQFKNCADFILGGTDLGGWISCAQSWTSCQYSEDPPPSTSGIGVGWLVLYCYGPSRIDIVPSQSGNVLAVDCAGGTDPIGIHAGFQGGMPPGPDDPPPCDIVRTDVPPEEDGQATWGGVKSLYQ
jgi:hypothetical protein